MNVTYRFARFLFDEQFNVRIEDTPQDNVDQIVDDNANADQLKETHDWSLRCDIVVYNAGYRNDIGLVW